MTMTFARWPLPAIVVFAAGCGGSAAEPATAPLPDPSGRYEVVGRGPVAHTHTSDLYVFRGTDGRDYAYTGTWGACQGCIGDRLYIWDVTEPASPALTDSVVVDARIVGDIAVNEARTIAAISRQGAPSLRNGIVLLSLEDPAHPTVLADYWETLTGGVHKVFIDGDLLYAVHTGTQDVHIIDISNPSDPRQIGRWGVPAHPAKRLLDVNVRDGLAYLSYFDDGLIVIDVGNGVRDGTPRNPQFVSQYRYRYEVQGRQFGNTATATPYTSSDGTRYIIVTDEILPGGFDIRRADHEPGGFVHIVNANDIENLVEVAQYRLPRSGPSQVWAEDDVLYVAHYNAGLRALDISGTLRGDLGQQGREIAALPTSDAQAYVEDRPFTWGVQYHEGLVYASDYTSGLWIARLLRNAGD